MRILFGFPFFPFPSFPKNSGRDNEREKSRRFKMKAKSFIRKKHVIIGAFFAVGILVLIYLNFYKRTVAVDCSYGSFSEKLIELAALDSNDREFSCLFLFSTLPRIGDIDLIEKVQRKYGETVTFLSLFSKRFRIENEIKAPHRFLGNKKILNRNKPEWENWFLLLKNDKAVYASKRIEQDEVLMILEKNANPIFSYTELSNDAERIRIELILRLRKKDIKLWSLVDKKVESFDTKNENSILSFVFGECSGCQIQEIFAKLKENEQKNMEPKTIYIFSFLSNPRELHESLRSYQIKSKLYYDFNDESGYSLPFLGTKSRILEIDNSYL